MLSRAFAPAYRDLVEINNQRLRDAVVKRLTLDARLARLERLNDLVQSLSPMRRLWWRVSGRLPRG